MLIFTKYFVYAYICKYKNGIFSMENYFLLSPKTCILKEFHKKIVSEILFSKK